MSFYRARGDEKKIFNCAKKIFLPFWHNVLQNYALRLSYVAYLQFDDCFICALNCLGCIIALQRGDYKNQHAC